MSKRCTWYSQARLLMAFSFTLVLLLSACHQVRPKVFDPSQVNFTVAYNPYLENQFYPSLVLGVASLSDLNYSLTDTNALFSVSVTAPVSNSDEICDLSLYSISFRLLKVLHLACLIISQIVSNCDS